MISGVILGIVLLICLFIRYRMKRSKKIEYSDKKGISNSYPFEQLCADFGEGREIEFTYDNARYLFIPENGRFFFKRIIAIDPYEYAILAESEDALACVDASAINGKKITGFWPDIEDITIY